MTVAIESNYTRYASEDIAAIVEEAAKIDFFDSKKRRVHTRLRPRGGRPFGMIRIEPLYGSEELVECAMQSNVVRLASPNKVWEQYPLHGLAAQGRTGKMPGPLLRELVLAILTWGAGLWVVQRGEMIGLERVVDRLVSRHSVRILEKPVDKRPAGKKLTPQESMARMLKFYGPGGVLYGAERTTRHWVRSGNRARRDQWDDRLEQAKEYYDREYDRAQKWREKIEAKGGSVVPYETFSDYLRRKADELEE